MRWGWERLAALAGIVAVVLWVASVLIEESTNIPDENPVSILSWFRAESDTILASSFVFMLGSLFFLVFVGALRTRLVDVEGPRAFLTAIAFAAGVGTSLMTLLIPGPDLAGALAEEDLLPETAQALAVMDDAFFIAAELTSALFLAAVGLTILRYRAFPRWLSWVSLLFALWLLIPPIGWAGLLIGLPLWTLVVSVLLWRTPAQAPPPVAADVRRAA